MNTFLSLGTAVQLQDGTKAVIIGYLPVNGKGKSDYVGVPYPVGMRNAGNMRCFDRKEIAQVIRIGYSSEKSQEFLENLASFEEELEKTGLTKVNVEEEA